MDGSVTEIHDNMLFDDTTVIYCAAVSEVVKDKQNLTAQVIAREDICNSVVQGNKYVLFTKIGEKYYALNGDATASEINVQGDLEEGAIIYYGGNDSRNISWEFDNIYEQNDVNTNIEVSIRNVKTLQYLYPSNGNMFSNSTDNRLRTICSFFTNNRWSNNRYKYW